MPPVDHQLHAGVELPRFAQDALRQRRISRWAWRTIALVGSGPVI